MPYPVACVKNSNKCTCYTEQGTPIKGFAKSQCLDFALNGIYNPYKAQTVEKPTQTVAVQQAEPQQVAVMGGQSPSNLMYDGYVEAGQKAGFQNGAKVGL